MRSVHAGHEDILVKTKNVALAADPQSLNIWLGFPKGHGIRVARVHKHTDPMASPARAWIWQMKLMMTRQIQSLTTRFCQQSYVG